MFSKKLVFALLAVVLAYFYYKNSGSLPRSRTVETKSGKDCLFLNVHVPKLERKEPLPMMVYIHGGGFFSMGGDDYTPEYFMDEDVVLVTFNYRLSILGFLNAGDKGFRGNMELKDQVMALRWIKGNIEYFGGDPERITIFGESAGGGSVHYMVLAEKETRGLFHKAIAMSGSAFGPWAYISPEKSISISKTIGARLNCPTGNGKEMADCLEKIDAGKLITAAATEMS